FRSPANRFRPGRRGVAIPVVARGAADLLRAGPAAELHALRTADATDPVVDHRWTRLCSTRRRWKRAEQGARLHARARLRAWRHDCLHLAWHRSRSRRRRFRRSAAATVGAVPVCRASCGTWAVDVRSLRAAAANGTANAARTSLRA